MISRIKKIEVFQTSDGKTFEESLSANHYEALLSLKQNLRDVLKDHISSIAIDGLLNDGFSLAKLRCCFITFEGELKQ